MIPLTAQQIADATAGRIVCGDARTRITCVCTDTRAMKSDSLFIAIKGDTFDGHDKLADAAAGGARVMLVHSEAAQIADGIVCVLVDDTRLALGRLARFVREQFVGTRVVAVAGSNGKTGTKHLIHSVLTTSL
jgi:UDP-N-acetylmuramoyl-tripeptide--D-alanyl-D-alanine ligase